MRFVKRFERLVGGVVLCLALGCAHAPEPCRCICEIKVPAAAHTHDVEPKRGEAVARADANAGDIVLCGDPPLSGCQRYDGCNTCTFLGGEIWSCTVMHCVDENWVPFGAEEQDCSPNIVDNTGDIVIDCETTE